MFNEPHDLFHEFPEYQGKIQSLQSEDSRFAELFNEYHRIDQEVHRIMVELETPSDLYIETLKKNRVYLKDKLYAILHQINS
ncbi:MAG: GTP-binding protein [Beggiatoa sp. IS2]|nr:MAG: GTP-binding protein [Beggiatoa sp. IS2]